MFFAVSGKIASGKDTAAKMLSQDLSDRGQTPFLLKFADPLYQLCAAYDDTTAYSEDGWEPRRATTRAFKQRISMQFVHTLERCGIAWMTLPTLVDELTDAAEQTPTRSGQKNRARMQLIAEEILRAKVDRDLWIKLAQPCLDQALAQGSPIVCSDFRYRNEACWLERIGAYRVRIDVSPKVQRMRMLAMGMEYTSARLFHRSEVDLDQYTNWTARFQNDGPLTDLTQFCRWIVSAAHVKVQRA